MKYEKVAIDSLIPYVKNARRHPAAQIMKIRSSLREFGFVNPVLVDEKLNVIAGHGRIIAAKEEGFEEVPCVYIEGLSDAQRKAYIIADNKIALDTEWDEEMLKTDIKSLLEEDIDSEAFGFTEDELNELFKVMDEDEEEGVVGFATPLEIQNNYLVLKFDNEIDWLQALTVFDVGKRQNLSTRKDGVVVKGMKATGVGRVLNGAEALNKLLGG